MVATSSPNTSLTRRPPRLKSSTMLKVKEFQKLRIGHKISYIKTGLILMKISPILLMRDLHVDQKKVE